MPCSQEKKHLQNAKTYISLTQSISAGTGPRKMNKIELAPVIYNVMKGKSVPAYYLKQSYKFCSV